jgi:transcriptional regulator with XRE-family HTH domain
MESFSDQLRRAIRDCGTTRSVLARRANVAESCLSRFMTGKAGLTISVIDRITDVLGVGLTPGPKLLPGRGRGRARGQKTGSKEKIQCLTSSS